MADLPDQKNLEAAVNSPALARISRVTTRIGDYALYLAGAGLVVMSCIVFWQVFCRYILNWSNSWTEITAVLLMSWFIFLGAAVGVRQNYHLGFDVLLYVLPKSGKRYLRAISDIAVGGFAVGMIVYGVQLVQLQWPAKLPALGITEGIRYLPLVCGGVLILLFSIERFVLRLAGFDVDPDLYDNEPSELELARKV